MRVGLTCERKVDFGSEPDDPPDINSELLSEAEQDELVSGLSDAGHTVIPIGDAKSLLAHVRRTRRTCDIVLNRSTGYRGTDRILIVPAILEAAAIPYVGCSPYIHALVRNKFHTKLLVADAGVPTPPATVVRARSTPDMSHILFPAIVKPIAESSSLGIELGKAVVHTPAAALARAHELVARYQQPALVETFVQGVEIEVPVVADPTPRALGAVAVTLDGQPVQGEQYLAWDAVYSDGYNFAAPPPDVDVGRTMDMATRAAIALEIRDYCRIDFRVAPDGTPWLMEANTLPHLQRHSSFYVVARQRGMEYHEMLDELLLIAGHRLGLKI